MVAYFDPKKIQRKFNKKKNQNQNFFFSHVHVLYYASNSTVKYLDIVQFIFTRCVVYSLEQKLSLRKKVEK